ncbi:MAG: ATP-binding protein [Desulfobacterales bacterium]
MVIIATMRSALLKLDRLKGVSEKVKQGLRVLKSFVGAVKVKYQEIEFSLDVDSEAGVADSGTLTRDLAELFVAAGEAAESRRSSIVILIDEIQNLPKEEFEALIMAVHRVDQKKLPVLIVGAGLPLLVKLTGDAKSYAERLFEYPRIGALIPEDIRRALAEPLEESGVKINDDAVDIIMEETQGYPYFVQEWGYQAWNAARKSPITRIDVEKCSKVAIQRLDQNFFHSRYERLSEPQKNYLRAMAELGPGPHKSGNVAELLGKETSQLGPTREGLIQNGMIYSPKYGYAAFTVPLFDEFMKRTEPRFRP